MRKNIPIAIFAIICFSILSGGCASVMDANFKTRDGKESSFKAPSNPYEIPRDPTFRE
jgi:hypothetical protein